MRSDMFGSNVVWLRGKNFRVSRKCKQCDFRPAKSADSAPRGLEELNSIIIFALFYWLDSFQMKNFACNFRTKDERKIEMDKKSHSVNETLKCAIPSKFEFHSHFFGCLVFRGKPNKFKTICFEHAARAPPTTTYYELNWTWKPEILFIHLIGLHTNVLCVCVCHFTIRFANYWLNH